MNPVVIKNAIPLSFIQELLNIVPEHNQWEIAGENGFVSQKSNRGSFRASIFSREKADMLSAFIKKHLPTFLSLDDSPFIDEHEQASQWVYEGINPLLRYIRYKEGNGILLPHYDVPYVYDDHKHSTLLSIVIYLESGIGGHTRMIKWPEARFKDLPQPDWDREPEKNEIQEEFICQPGDILVFPHTLLHDSSLVTAQQKTIIRTDATYRRI